MQATETMREAAIKAAIIYPDMYENDGNTDITEADAIHDGRQIAYAQVLATLAVCDALDNIAAILAKRND